MANNIKFCGVGEISLEVIAGRKTKQCYPDVWRADVGIKRLRKAVDKGSYFLFVYTKERTTVVYAISASELLVLCQKEMVSINSNGMKYELYIQHKTGKVFKSTSEESFVFQLHSKKVFSQHV